MRKPMESMIGPVYLRARPIIFFAHFCVALLLFFLGLFLYFAVPQPPMPLGSFAKWDFVASFLLFLFFCSTFQPYIVADTAGLHFNMVFKKKTLAWREIGEVEWRYVGHAAHVYRVYPVLKDHQDKDLAVIDYGNWGRNEAEQTKFIEFVGQQIKATS